MKGIQLACIYSFGCPELDRIKVQNTVFDFITNPQEEKLPLIKEILKKLEPFLFYRLIALQNQTTDPFGKDIVKAYWLGGSTLKSITMRDIENFPLEEVHLVTHRLFFKKLLDLNGGKAHHNFETLWLTKGLEINQGIPPKFLMDLNNCLVKAGQVIYIGKLMCQVKTEKIIFQNGGIASQESREIVNRRGFERSIRKGDFVSIHLGIARRKITRKIARNLSDITQEAISFFGRA